MATTMSRLQIAHRIHQLLLREIGHEVQIERLLSEPRYARDVLLVCDACPGGELVPLAALFRGASQAVAPAAGPARPASAPGHAQQATEWSRDTSGFGVSQPVPLGSTPPGAAQGTAPGAAPAEERRRGWLPRWRDPK